MGGPAGPNRGSMRVTVNRPRKNQLQTKANTSRKTRIVKNVTPTCRCRVRPELSSVMTQLGIESSAADLSRDCLYVRAG